MANIQLTTSEVNNGIRQGRALDCPPIDVSTSDCEIKNSSPENRIMPFYVKAITGTGIIKVKTYFGYDRDIHITELNKYDECLCVKVYSSGTTATGIIAAV